MLLLCPTHLTRKQGPNKDSDSVGSLVSHLLKEVVIFVPDLLRVRFSPIILLPTNEWKYFWGLQSVLYNKPDFKLNQHSVAATKII